MGEMFGRFVTLQKPARERGRYTQRRASIALANPRAFAFASLIQVEVIALAYAWAFALRFGGFVPVSN